MPAAIPGPILRGSTREVFEMKRMLVVLGVLAALGVAPAATSAQTATKVTVAMHDPGCHWFQVGTTYRESLTVRGPVSLFNVDEAALVVKGPTGRKLDPVGKSLRLVKGVYRITMVKQAPDDNHLLLRVL
jgi:hypothetical protein